MLSKRLRHLSGAGTLLDQIDFNTLVTLNMSIAQRLETRLACPEVNIGVSRQDDLSLVGSGTEVLPVKTALRSAQVECIMVEAAKRQETVDSRNRPWKESRWEEI